MSAIKKVGITTFHNNNNFGAVLQAYALKKAIDKCEGYQASIVNNDFRSGEIKTENEILKEKLGDRNKSFDMFRQEYLNINRNKKEKYDYCIAGSDQIWNPKISGLDKEFFLNYSNDETIKIAYAASISVDKRDFAQGREYYACNEIFKNELKRFHYISVREESHREFIQQFTDKNVETVLDPTLLLDVADYDELLLDKPSDKYILLYCFSYDMAMPAMIDFANKLALKYNLKIIHYFSDMPDGMFANEVETFAFDGPKEFVTYVKNAEYVITDSYHGTLFSILYQKAFYTFLISNMSSRIVDILNIFHLEDRIIYGYKMLNSVNKDIDWNMVEKIILKEKSKSNRYLKGALEI